MRGGLQKSIIRKLGDDCKDAETVSPVCSLADYYNALSFNVHNYNVYGSWPVFHNYRINQAQIQERSNVFVRTL